MTDTISIIEQARQFAATRIAEAPLLPYHNIETFNRAIESLELLSAEEHISTSESEVAALALNFYFTGFGNVAAKSVEAYFQKARQNSVATAQEWLSENGYPASYVTMVRHLLESLFFKKQPDTPAGKVASDALGSDWAREKGKKHLNDLFEQLMAHAGLHVVNLASEEVHWLYDHCYFTKYGKSTLETGKIHLIEKLEKEVKSLDHEADIILKKELHLDGDELKKLKKKLKDLKERDDKSFMDMLRCTSRNHYLLNQMVDRKARIIVWVNAFMLSFIIKIMLDLRDINWQFYLLVLISFSGLVSIFYAVLAIRLETSHGKLSAEDIRQSKGNPLFFGNFQTLPPDEYEDSMMVMVNNKEFVFRAMIQDIYYLGQTLQQKNLNLYTSLYIFLSGLAVTLLLTIILRVLKAG